MSETRVKTWVLRNGEYYVVFPYCGSAAAEKFKKMAKKLYGEKLSYAKLAQRKVSVGELKTACELKLRPIL